MKPRWCNVPYMDSYHLWWLSIYGQLHHLSFPLGKPVSIPLLSLKVDNHPTHFIGNLCWLAVSSTTELRKRYKGCPFLFALGSSSHNCSYRDSDITVAPRGILNRYLWRVSYIGYTMILVIKFLRYCNQCWSWHLSSVIPSKVSLLIDMLPQGIMPL